MPVKTILFDLDGTLLPMDQDVFVKSYFKRLAAKLAPLGYESQQLIEWIQNLIAEKTGQLDFDDFVNQLENHIRR